MLCKFYDERPIKRYNTVVVGAVSSVLFTILVILSSYITTYFMGALEEPSWHTESYYYSYYISPWSVGKDLVRAALRILKEESGFEFDDERLLASRTRMRTDSATGTSETPNPPGALRILLKRFSWVFFLLIRKMSAYRSNVVLGLPMVGAGSLVHMMLSLPLLGPLHWLARYRGNRSRRGDSRDAAAMVVIVLLLVGAAR